MHNATNISKRISKNWTKSLMSVVRLVFAGVNWNIEAKPFRCALQ
jgi:hypothetical protein